MTKCVQCELKMVEPPSKACETGKSTGTDVGLMQNRPHRGGCLPTNVFNVPRTCTRGILAMCPQPVIIILVLRVADQVKKNVNGDR